MIGGPESTNVPQSTTTTSSATRSTSSSPASTSAPTSSGSSSKSSSSNAGPIAGGVVGGVVGLALLAALVFWWTRRRRTQPAQSALVDPMTTYPSSPAAISFNQTVPLVGAPSPKLYVRPSLSPLSVLILIYPGPFRSEYIPFLASDFWHLYHAGASALFAVHLLKSKPGTRSFIP
jgi:hypothetical protein